MSFLTICVEKLTKIVMQSLCVTWFKLEPALKKKLELSKDFISSKQAAIAADLIISLFPFHSVLFHLPFRSFFLQRLWKEVRSVSGRQYPRHFVCRQKRTYLRIRLGEGNHSANVNSRTHAFWALNSRLFFLSLESWNGTRELAVLVFIYSFYLRCLFFSSYYYVYAWIFIGLRRSF